MQIECPPPMLRHVEKVLRGEYDIAYSKQAPVILDIGANVGSFAAWAVGRWPGAHVHCYEPLPANFELLKRNLGVLERRQVTLNNFAIGDPSLKRLRLGANNCGEASFFDIGEQSAQTVEVECRHPDVLPRADILKIDTEGSEIDILTRLPEIAFDVVLLEYHSESNRRRIDQLLPAYVLAGGEIRHIHRGTLKYLHRRLIT